MDTVSTQILKRDIVDCLFPEKAPRTLLLMWSILCCIFFSIYTKFDIQTNISIIATLLLFLGGYMFWVLLFTIDGQYFYDKFLSFYLEVASYPKKIRIYFILSTSIIGFFLGTAIIIYNIDSISSSDLFLSLDVGLVLGFAAFLRIPNYSLSRHRKNIALFLNLFRVCLPIMFLPFLLSEKNIAFWAAGIAGYSITYGFSELAILFRHYSINYALSKINFPDNPRKEVTNADLVKDLKVDEKLLSSRENISIDDLCGIRTKCYQNVAKKVVYNLTFSRRINREILESPDKLREIFRIWYSEREYLKIIKYGDLYIRNHVENRNFEDLSYVVVSTYFRALLRLGDNNLTQKKLMESYGKQFNLIYFGVERANYLWNIGKTQDAIEEIRALLNEEPRFSIAKNCLAYYLAEVSATNIFIARLSKNKSKRTILDQKAKGNLEEADRLLAEIASNSILTDVNSYYWSNVGYIKMLKQNPETALEYFGKSINLIRSKENPRSHYGIGLVQLAIYNDFNESKYHFQRAMLDVNRNRSSRYYIICDLLIKVIDILLAERRKPSVNFLYCPNALFNHFGDMKTKLNINNLATIIPLKMMPKA